MVRRSGSVEELFFGNGVCSPWRRYRGRDPVGDLHVEKRRSVHRKDASCVGSFGVVISIGAYIGLTNIAIDKRVVSNYFGNIAFAYEDYRIPVLILLPVSFNTEFSEPSGYSKETMDEITDGGEFSKSSTGLEEGEMPNIMFVQLESFFDPTEVEWLQFSEDPIPNLRKMFQNYSSGYFKAPSDRSRYGKYGI